MPYNRLLFDQLSEKIPPMLVEKAYDHRKKSVFNMGTVVKDKQTREMLGHSYTLKNKTEFEIRFEFGLTVSRNKNHTYYYFEMIIMDIRMQNLGFANTLLRDVQIILDEIEYYKFKEILER